MIVVCINEIPSLTLGKKYSVIDSEIANNQTTWVNSTIYTVKDDRNLISIFSEKYVREVSEMRESKIKILGI